MGLFLTTLLQIEIKPAEWMDIDLTAFPLKTQCYKAQEFIVKASIYFKTVETGQ